MRKIIIYIVLFYVLIVISSGLVFFIKKEKNILIIISSELKKIEKKLKNIFLWSNYVGKCTGKYYSNIHPANIGMLVFAADRYGIVKAIYAKNGKNIWIQDLSIYRHFKYKNYPALLSGGITVSNQKLYIGSERAKVYAINIYDGSIIWKSNVAGEVLSTPVVSNDGLILLVHTSNGILQALNIYDGTIKWIVNLDIPQVTLRGQSTPNIFFSYAIIGGDNGIISAILIENGQIIWQQQISYPSGITEITNINDIHTTSIVINSVVYAIAYNGNIAAIDIRSGKIIWYKEIGSVTKSLVVKEKTIYFIDQNNLLIAININDGMILWCKKYLINSNLTSLVLYKGYLLTSDLEGYIHLINPDDGILVTKIKVDSSGLLSTPIIVNNKLVVQAKNGIIYALSRIFL